VHHPACSLADSCVLRPTAPDPDVLEFIAVVSYRTSKTEEIHIPPSASFDRFYFTALGLLYLGLVANQAANLDAAEAGRVKPWQRIWAGRAI
jgi:hypothetical protein